MDEGSLYELAESIKAQGIMQPILVRSVGDQGCYEIIAGERRSRAAKLPACEVPVPSNGCPTRPPPRWLPIIENIQREDLNPLEEAQGLKRSDRRVRPHPREAAQGRRSFAQRGQQFVAL